METTPVYLIRKNRTLPSGSKIQFWLLRWAGTGGKQHTESVGRCDDDAPADERVNERQAEKLRREKENAINNGRELRDKPRKLTIADFTKLDRESIKSSQKHSSIRQHKLASDHVIAALGADFPVHRVDWNSVAKIKNWLSEPHKLGEKTLKAARPATIRKTIATLKAIWNRGIKRRLVPSNPFTIEKLGKVQSKQKRIYSPAEIEAMIDVAPDAWWKAIIRLGFTTGLRLGEMLSLTWDDIDEKRGTITVSAKRPEKFEVGGITYRMLEWSSKSHHERTVPLQPKAAEAIKRLRLISGGSPYLFISLDRLQGLNAFVAKGESKEPWYWVNNMRRDFNVIQKHAREQIADQRKVKIDKVEWRTGTIHDLRKSFGTHTAQHVRMHELQRLMGHSSITVTADFYTEVDADLSAKVARAFAATA